MHPLPIYHSSSQPGRSHAVHQSLLNVYAVAVYRSLTLINSFQFVLHEKFIFNQMSTTNVEKSPCSRRCRTSSSQVPPRPAQKANQKCFFELSSSSNVTHLLHISHFYFVTHRLRRETSFRLT